MLHKICLIICKLQQCYSKETTKHALKSSFLGIGIGQVIIKSFLFIFSVGREEEKESKMKSKSKSGNEKVRLNVRLDHQVEFGESVVILGSIKELGSWKKKVPMNWTESGWVCSLEFKGGESVEYKFLTVKADKSVLWEGGDNRVLKFPKGGNFGIVSHWNATGEAVDLLPLEKEEDVGNNGSTIVDTVSTPEVGTSPFVGQWKGNATSFMRSNEHGNREAGRRWDTSGLEGLALKLVEGDRNARNWWRKVPRLIGFYLNFQNL